MNEIDGDLTTEREAKARVQITRVENGYQVQAWEVTKKKRTMRTMFGSIESNTRRVDYVFPTLGDVVQFLGKHYEEPTTAIRFQEAPDA